MDKLLKSLGKYLAYHIPQAVDPKTTFGIHEEKGNVSIVFFLNKKEIGRTRPRLRSEVEEYLTYILYASDSDDELVPSAGYLHFAVMIILASTVTAIIKEGLFDKKGYYPAMMLDEMFTEIHEVLNG